MWSISLSNCIKVKNMRLKQNIFQNTSNIDLSFTTIMSKMFQYLWNLNLQNLNFGSDLPSTFLSNVSSLRIDISVFINPIPLYTLGNKSKLPSQLVLVFTMQTNMYYLLIHSCFFWIKMTAWFSHNGPGYKIICAHFEWSRGYSAKEKIDQLHSQNAC